MIRVGIVGITSYTGEELIKLLLKNKDVEITSLSARVEDKTSIADLYPELKGKLDVPYKTLDIDDVAGKSDIVFLALPHTVSKDIVPEFLKKKNKVIDLSADYRLPGKVYSEWYGTDQADEKDLDRAVYGLPELNREKIRKAQLVANPGCYPTSIVLGLLPVIKDGSDNEGIIIVDSKSGITGAGRKAAEKIESDDKETQNFKCYKPNAHQHIPEIEHILSKEAGKKIEVTFVPHLLPIKRGILSTIYVRYEGMEQEEHIYDLYKQKYANEPFVRIKPLGEMPEIKDVAYTNFCDIGIKVTRGTLIIVSVIDNLLKGASGQAVQNMNIMCGFDESAGLD
ncbi:MAG: N-acetyl-gamma-glutamyl-phosphate reductase [Candidatus Omnitrophota bacterium]